jgi:simple sugar transport system ATP-binding protein
MGPVVEMKNVTKRFGSVLANDGIDLDVGRGDLHAVVGENGAGKSTLMHILAGLLQQDAGTVAVEGHRPRLGAQGTREGVGLVAQHFSLVPTFAVWENVVLGREPTRMGRLDRARAASEVDRLADTLGIQLPLDVPVGSLAVGTRQIVEILKALYGEARILILDEPTSAISPPEADRLFTLLNQLRQQGVTVILVTHRVAEVTAHATGATVLRQGRVVADIPGHELSTASLVSAVVGDGLQDVDAVKPRRINDRDEPLLEVVDLSVTQHGGAGTDGLSLSLYPGEILGIAGVAGNGQAQLVDTITGHIRPTSGDVRIRGRSVARLPVAGRRRAGLAFIPEDRNQHGLVMDFAVRDNLILGDHRRFSSPWGIRPESVAHHTADLIRRFDIRSEDAGHPVADLSGGNQQKTVIARELSRNPDVVLAANPFRGLDVAASAFVRKQLLAIRERGGGVLVLSPDLDELTDLADRIVVLYRGRIAGEQRRGAYDPQRIGEQMVSGAY